MNMNPYLGFIKAGNFKSLFLLYIYRFYIDLREQNINKYDFFEKSCQLLINQYHTISL
jgi:hypothetical protein